MTDSLPVQSQNGHILMDNANGGGGAIFAFGAKIGLEQARSKEFALGGCFGGWKQHQTILNQRSSLRLNFIGLHSD